MSADAGSEPVQRFRASRARIDSQLGFEHCVFETFTSHRSVSAPAWDGVGLRPVEERRRTRPIDELREDPTWIACYNRKLNLGVPLLILSSFSTALSRLYGHAVVERIRRGDDQFAAELGLTASDLPRHPYRPCAPLDRAVSNQLRRDFESARTAFKQHFNVEVEPGILHNDVSFVFMCRNIGRDSKVGSFDVVPNDAPLAEPRSLKPGAVPGELLQFTREEVLAAFEILLQYLERIDEGLNRWRRSALQ